MENKRGEKPLHTANYVEGQIKKLIDMLLQKRRIYDVFVLALGVYALLHKLIYKQLEPELRFDIFQCADRHLQRSDITSSQREALENIKQAAFSFPSDKLCKLHHRLTKLEEEMAVE